MRLLVDMGNSSIKWASLEKEQLSSQQRLSYDRESLTQAWLELPVPTQIFISNVAGAEKAAFIKDWIKTHWGLQANFLKSTGYQCGVKNAYDNPEQLGVDRWLALLATHRLETGAICIVDCGTAITLDVLSANGNHQGGLIMPGLTTMHNALLSNTDLSAYLKRAGNVHQKPGFLAHDTHNGISLGSLYAIIGLLEYVKNRYKTQGNPLKLILTGGSVPALKPLLQKPYRYIPDLVLQGLQTIVNQ
jgi:type III pantothenate kinase